jgi:GT2 family glycosyltransferase/glycosyltransferase involved in cell wall biosynthesis
VQSLALDTRCHAIEQWTGEVALPAPAEPTFRSLEAHNRRYAGFSQLLPGSAGDALGAFRDGTIDLLHIERGPLAASAMQDFERWRPKLSDRALVLIPGIATREGDTGLQRLWQALRTEFPSFDFPHGEGLGVLGYGANLPAEVAAFFRSVADPGAAAERRATYAQLGAATGGGPTAGPNSPHLASNAEPSGVEAKEIASRLAQEIARGTALESKLAEQEARARRADALHRSRATEVQSRDREIARLKAERVRSNQVIATLAAQLEEIRRSRSWRATAPLRALASRFDGRPAKLRVAAEPGASAPAKAPLPPAIAEPPKEIRKAPAGPLDQAARKAAVATAEEASKAANWPAAVERWLEILESDGRGPNDTAEDRLATACLGLMEGDGFDRAMAALQRAKSRRRPRKSILAAEAIGFLRAARTDEARRLWGAYWQRALKEESFATAPNPTIPSRYSGNGVFAVASANAEAGGEHALRICVYTAVFGDYDDVQPPGRRPTGIDFICFTDRPRAIPGWEVRAVDPGVGHPAAQNRAVKTLPHRYLGEYDASLYIDANIALVDPASLIRRWFAGKRFVAWRHPARSDVYDECEAILANLRNEPGAILAQHAFFATEKLPRHTGLIASGVLWRDHRDGEVKRLMELWWEQLRRFGKRDQPGLGYLMWKTGIRPEVLPAELGTIYKNEFLAFRPHNMTTIELERGRAAHGLAPDLAKPPARPADGPPLRPSHAALANGNGRNGTPNIQHGSLRRRHVAALRHSLDLVARLLYRRAPLPMALKLRIKESLLRLWRPGHRRQKPVRGRCEYFSPRGRLPAFESWQIYNRETEAGRNAIELALSALERAPTFSVLMPVYDPPLPALDAAIRSVLAQTYGNFTLVLVDDCSTDPAIRPRLEEWAALDARIRLVLRPENGHISAATNSAAEVAEGDYLVFVDNDDELPDQALAHFALYLQRFPEADILYSDDAKLDRSGTGLTAPKFKPDWSPELLLSYCYVSHLKAIRASLYREIGGSRLGFEGSQDHDMLLRASERARHVGHVPQILYRRRVLPTSTASSGHAKPYSFEAGRRAVEEAFARRGLPCRVIHPDWAARDGLGIYVPVMPDTGPSVAIIIPTRNNHLVLDGLLRSLPKTTYRNYAVHIVDNMSDDPATLAYLARQPHPVTRIANPGDSFSYAHINNAAVKNVSEELILFLNDDTEVIEPRWLSQMVGWSRLPGVGAVGARLIFPDGRVQHAGVALGLREGLTAFRGMAGSQSGYLWFAKVTRNCAAVSAATMLTPRALFLEVGGFDEGKFPVAYNDVDYCLRLQDRGYRTVFCGEAELYHDEGQSRGRKPAAPAELAALTERCRGRRDHCYSPHLDRDGNRYEIKPTVLPPIPRTKPLRVLVVTHNLNHEGAPNSALELVVGLRQKGVIDPVVLSPQDGPLRAAYEARGIPVEIVPEARIASALRNLQHYEDRIANLCNLVGIGLYDLVYCNTALTFWAVDAARRMNVPSVWNIRESEPWTSYYDNLPKEVARRALQCFAIPYRVLFVADSTRALWSPVDRMSNFHVIRNGLDLARFGEKTRVPRRDAARRALGVADDELCLLALGTVCARKGQKELVLALNELEPDVAQRLAVFIVGARRNAYSDELRELVAAAPAHLRDRVRIVDETGETAVYWNAADLFCCNSHQESYPRVTLEAMAMGLPIVTTPVFGIKEQVRDEVNALFYNPGDVRGLADRLARVIEDDELRNHLAANSRDVLQSLVSYSDMLEEYATAFESAAFSAVPQDSELFD